MTAMLNRPSLTTRRQQLVEACDVAARRLYDAESALHTAREANIDAWIAAAYDKLHAAVEAHRAAVTELSAAEPGSEVAAI
jgi:hypothetical protein